MTKLLRSYEDVTIEPQQYNKNNPPERQQHPAFDNQINSLEEIKWYHGELTRTAAESLLLQNEILESTYLLRKSQRRHGYSISVKCQGGIIKHFMLEYNNRIHEFKFGNASFPSLVELLRHFESCPILTKDNDIPVTLIHPYCIGEEPTTYDIVDGHAEAGSGTFHVQQKQNTAVGSKGGYLTKRGNIVKNWKRRWFKSERKTLAYYENNGSDRPIREMDLTNAHEVAEDSIDDKINCFRLVFPNRTFYFVADSPSDAKEWIDHFQWKIDYFKDDTTPEV